ncbi:hypothetical protein BGZ82_009483 [Podila clonocystis]|nr:hypothetical protein BGZ82_009483 [Podila clonocystis]
MANIKQRIAQQWPRVTVGLYAVWGLLSNLATLWLGIQLNSFVNNRKFLGANHSSIDSGLGPEEEDRVIKSTLIIFGALFTLFNAIALYAAIRKSITAAKTSFIIWVIQMSWVVMVLVILFISLMGTQRNVWGFLVKTGGVFEYEPVENPGPLHL